VNKGIVYLIGAGPGDPGLLTIRAKELIEAADVIVYDYLANPRLLDWTRGDAEKIYVGKSAGRHSIPQDEIEELLVRGDIILAFILPPDFEEDIISGKTAKVQVIANGSDANTASVALGYQAALFNSYGAEIVQQRFQTKGLQNISLPEANERTRLWYNPELKSTFFIAPGVIAIVSMLLGSLLTATSLVREKESGTIEMLASMPIKSIDLILGKILPYIIVAFIDIIIVILLAHFVLGVPIKGSVPLLLLGSLLFLICALGIGLFASAIASTVSAAQFVVIFASLLPSVLLSGFIFPIESMPKAVQLITYIVPARYFITILRGIFLKDVGFDVLWAQYVFLAAFGFIVTTVSAMKFKKKLD
jgi:ABC-2 type transport system permease protein